MMNLLKLLGKGLLYIILLPAGIAFFTVYGVYLLIVWVVMFFRTIILFFMGKPTGLKLPEDIKAEEILNNSRDFREPQPQQQQTGVTLNFNLNGQQVDQRKGTIVHSEDPESIDYTNEDKKDGDNND